MPVAKKGEKTEKGEPSRYPVSLIPFLPYFGPKDLPKLDDENHPLWKVVDLNEHHKLMLLLGLTTLYQCDPMTATNEEVRATLAAAQSLIATCDPRRVIERLVETQKKAAEIYQDQIPT